MQGIDRNKTSELMLNTFFIRLLIKKKNAAKCSDDEGTSKFNCTCQPQIFGERCDNDPCTFYECQNNGSCIVDVFNSILTPRCECSENYSGATCHLLSCTVPCYNNGTCYGESCQCSEENGIVQYYGVSCHMPAACNGNPCQNDGKCTSITQSINDIQDFFINV